MQKFTYDMHYRIEPPTFVLSNVWHHQIGVLNNIDLDSVQVNFNMNSQQEVSFDIYKELNGEKCKLWDDVKSFKYIFIPEHNEYYKADVSIDDSNKTVKHVVFSSASEYELSNKIIRSLEINTDVDILRQDRDETGQTPAYIPNVLYNEDDPSNSILHRILADKAPDWSISHVDNTIANIQRTFSISNQKIYDCLTQTIAKEYDCLFQFDSVNRTISCYDLLNKCNDCGKRGEFIKECPDCHSTNITKGYGKDTHIFITYNNFSEKITLDGDEAAVKNCFSVQGGDDIITSRVRLYNPNGSEYFYNFSKEDYEDMPEELVNKLEAYQDLYNSRKSEYEELAQNWTEALDEYYYYKTTMMPRLYDIQRWEKSKGYDVGDACYVRTLPSWCHLECVEAGTTGTEEPDLPYPTENQIVEDGTVKWKVCKNILTATSAQQELNNVVNYFAYAPIYFHKEIPTKKVVENEIENMASLQINNLYRVELSDGEILNEVTPPDPNVYDPVNIEDKEYVPYCITAGETITGGTLVNIGIGYTFHRATGMIALNEFIKLGSYWYYFGSDGIMVFDTLVYDYYIDDQGRFTYSQKNIDSITKIATLNKLDTDGTFEYSQESRTWNWTGVDTGKLRPWDHSWIGDLGSNRPIAGIKDWYFLTGWVDESTTQVSYNNTSAVAYNHRIFNCPSSYDYAWDGKTPKAISGKKWKGNVRVYDSGDPEKNTAKTENPIKIELIIAETLAQYTDYMSEKVQKRLDKKDITFTKIFDIPFDEAIDGDGKYHKNKDITFKEALKEYGLDSLESFWKSYDGCMDVLRNNGVTDPTSSFMPFNLYYPLYEPYYGRQQLIEEEMAIRESTVNTLKTKYEGYREEMNKINEELNLEKYLGKDLINTFWAYTREDTYQNQNYVSTELSEREISDRTQELIKKAQEELQKACKLQITLQDSVKNLLNTEEFKNYKDEFNIGDYIAVEVDDELYRLRLITTSFSYSNPDNISFTFSNATRIQNYFADAQSVIDSAKTISGSYNAVVHQVEQSATVTEEVTDWVDNGLSSALANIMNNDHEEILIDENGLTAKEWDETTREYGQEQFRITHNSIQFTEDGWQTAALGIGKNTYIWYNSDPNDLKHPLGWNTSEGYGVNAKFVTAGYINGSQFIGGEIYSDNYTIASPEQGIAADGSYINLRNGNFTLGGGGLVGTRNGDGTYTLSYNGNITGHADVGVGSHIGTWTVYADGLHSGSSVLKPDNIYVTGNVRASDFIVGIGSGSYNLSTKISNIETNKQDLLTAGDNITIEKIGDDTVISATGGAGLEYWVETATQFYREGTHEGTSGLVNFLKSSNNEIGYYLSGQGWSNAIVVRLLGNPRNVIMGYTLQYGHTHPILAFASPSPDVLDFEWGENTNGLYPPYNVVQWKDKSSYPVPTSGFDYYFGYATTTITYKGTSWNILLVDCLYWDGGDGVGARDGIAPFVIGKYGNKPDPADVGLDLLETAHALPYTTVKTEIGTEAYTFKYGNEDTVFASIDTDGNAVFNEITTKNGTLTSQMSAKQDNIIAGTNVQIGADGKTISATDTNEITELVDVTITNLADGEILKYDATNQKWVNAESGTVVEANPSGVAADAISKIAIDSVVYDISGRAYIGTSNPSSSLGEDGDVYYKYTSTPDVYEKEVTLSTIPFGQNIQISIDNFNLYSDFTFTYNNVYSETLEMTLDVDDIPETTTPISNGYHIYEFNNWLYLYVGKDSNGLWIARGENCVLSKLVGTYHNTQIEIVKAFTKIDGKWIEQPSSGGGGGGGTGSFVGLTKAEYDALPTADKKDTSKLYFVQEGGGTTEVTDLIGTSSDWGMYREYSMTITWNNNDEIVFDWTGGSSIGGDIVKTVVIPANASKIRFKITTGSAYDATIQRFKLGVGVRTTYTTNVVLDGYNVSDWLAFKNFNTTNSVWEDELDLSNVTVDTYLYIIAHGWDATVNKLEMVTTDSSEATYHTYWNNVKRAQWNQIKELTQAEYNALSTTEKQNGNLYLTHDGGYDFISYDNDKIIVRINSTTGQIIWFFNGFTKTADDMTVPSELVPYLPKQTQSGDVELAWAWTDDTSTTRNGAIGFVYPGKNTVKIRSWNNNYSQLMAGTFWGTVIIDDIADQHTNYSSPTEGLSLLPNRIYFNGTKYAENSASGGGSGGMADLYTASNTTAPSTITLDDDPNNYDAIIIHIKSSVSGRATIGYTYLVSALADGDVIGGELAAGSGWIWYSYSTNTPTTLTYVGANQNYYIAKIVGVSY